MVRTRRTNKTKRYTEFAAGLEDDDVDGAARPIDPGADDLSDFAADHNEDEVSAQEDDESEANDDDDAADISDGVVSDATPAKRRSRPAQTQREKAAATTQKHGVDHHQLPVYPLDPRISTRAYTGPLKRGVRSAILRDVMYGPEYSKAKLIWDLNERWSRYAVLPARHPPQHPEGVLPSPWVPLGFEVDQQKLAAKWYDDYMTTSTERSRSHPVLQKHGEHLIPQGQGELAVLLGPVDRQKEVRLGTSTGRALNATALPVDEPDNPNDSPNGWVFDVGGIVVALGWAPMSRSDKQILALAVIPHSDQARPTEDPTTPVEDEERNGSIQFWEFSWERDQEERPRPCRSPPKFLLAKCFDWGRPKRMQWCPVSFGMAGGMYGTLAVLCGDGRVRVVGVQHVAESGKTTYGECQVSRYMLFTY